jgi:hypothetical protein
MSNSAAKNRRWESKNQNLTKTLFTSVLHDDKETHRRAFLHLLQTMTV